MSRRQRVVKIAISYGLESTGSSISESLPGKTPVEWKKKYLFVFVVRVKWVEIPDFWDEMFQFARSIGDQPLTKGLSTQNSRLHSRTHVPSS